MRNNQRQRFYFLVMLLLCLIIQAASAVFSQTPPDPSQLLSDFMQEMRERKPEPAGRAVTIARDYGAKLIPDLKQYAKDPDSQVAHTAYRILSIISHRSESPSDCQQAVEALLPLLDDERLAHAVQNSMQEWRANDFSDSAKQFLAQRLREKRTPVTPSILAVGIADMKSELPRLAEFTSSIPQPGGQPIYWQHAAAWAALRARARLGGPEDIKKCIDIVETSSDKETKANMLFLSLAYVRQPEVAKYLIGYLNDDTVYEEPGNAELHEAGQRTQIAGRAAEALKTMIEGFPQEGVYSEVTPEKLKECREWVAAQKELSSSADIARTEPFPAKWRNEYAPL